VIGGWQVATIGDWRGGFCGALAPADSRRSIPSSANQRPEMDISGGTNVCG